MKNKKMLGAKMNEEKSKKVDVSEDDIPNDVKAIIQVAIKEDVIDVFSVYGILEEYKNDFDAVVNDIIDAAYSWRHTDSTKHDKVVKVAEKYWKNKGQEFSFKLNLKHGWWKDGVHRHYGDIINKNKKGAKMKRKYRANPQVQFSKIRPNPQVHSRQEGYQKTYRKFADLCKRRGLKIYTTLEKLMLRFIQGEK